MEPMPALFEFHHTVSTAEIDFLGHVGNVAYVRWMQDAAVAHSAAAGWPMEAHKALGSGWVVRTHEIEYRQPAFAGDAIVVRTWIADLLKVTSLRRYRILRAADEALLAVAATNWAYIDFATGRLMRVPPEVVAAFEVLPD
jgi:acyl-CoA thioester hydrolase